MHKIKAIKNK